MLPEPWTVEVQTVKDQLKVPNAEVVISTDMLMLSKASFLAFIVEQKLQAGNRHSEDSYLKNDRKTT